MPAGKSIGTLEEIARGLMESNGVDTNVSTAPHANRFANRFGEVLAAWTQARSLQEVVEITGLSRYIVRRYYLANPQFRELLDQANQTIFLEATQSIRDEQKNLVERTQRLAEAALDKLEALMNESESEHIVVKCAQDLADRDPRISRTRRVEASSLHVTIEAKTLALASEAAREIEATVVSNEATVEDVSK